MQMHHVMRNALLSAAVLLAATVAPASAQQLVSIKGEKVNMRAEPGPRGDVLWGDYKPSGQPGPRRQQDVLIGGRGDDYIYGSHGRNRIVTGGAPWR